MPADNATSLALFSNTSHTGLMVSLIGLACLAYVVFNAGGLARLGGTAVNDARRAFDVQSQRMDAVLGLSLLAAGLTAQNAGVAHPVAGGGILVVCGMFALIAVYAAGRIGWSNSAVDNAASNAQIKELKVLAGPATSATPMLEAPDDERTALPLRHDAA